MTLGCVGAVVAAWPCYFAGLLVALRPARWYGSRILPLAAALPLPFLNGSGAIPEFWQVAALSLIVCVVYVTAGYGAFAGTGEFERQSRPTKTALAAFTT